MAFSLADHWVWDSWLADDGDRFHLFYLHAPTSLGDPHLRHRNARIGHATSSDLVTWHDLGPVLGPGAAEDFDATATWTGSVVRGDDGLWRMFYTGAHFLEAGADTNIETVGVATSPDLHHWTKGDGPVTRADPRWYEVLADGTWREEAWRDPWVFADAAGDGWHMLVTARAASGDLLDRGVIGHARSRDLVSWEVLPPLSSPGMGFSHLEVPQIVDAAGGQVLVFSCDGAALAGGRSGARGGVWTAPAASATGPFDLARASLVVTDDLYAGRIVRDRAGRLVLLAFENGAPGGAFVGTISDPRAVQL